MSTITATMRRHPALGAGILSGAAGSALGEALGAQLRAHNLSEYGAAAPAIDVNEILQQHLLRENGGD